MESMQTMDNMVIRESAGTANNILSEPEILAKGKLQQWQIQCLFSKARIRSLAASRQI